MRAVKGKAELAFPCPEFNSIQFNLILDLILNQSFKGEAELAFPCPGFNLIQFNLRFNRKSITQGRG